MMKTGYLFFVLIFVLFDSSYGQTAEEVYSKYKSALASFDNLSYNLHNIDTFASGQIWDEKGRILIDRASDQEVSFYGFNETHNRGFLFGKGPSLDISYSQNTYSEYPQVMRSAIGSAGGRMMLPEVVFSDGPKPNKMTLEEKEDVYKLKLYFPPSPTFGIEKRFKELHIRKFDYLPLYTYEYFLMYNEKQVHIKYLADIKLNQEDFPDVLFDLEKIQTFNNVPFGKKREVQKVRSLEGKVAPYVELTALNGEAFNMKEEHKGKVILLDFFEIWCGPCLESIPKIKELARRYPSDQFEVWAVVHDQRTFEKIPKFVKNREIEYPTLFGTKESEEEFGVNAFPTYAIIDKKGVIQFLSVGYSDEIEEILDRLLLGN